VEGEDRVGRPEPAAAASDRLAFWSLGTVALHPERCRWREAVADVTFTALYLMPVLLAPGVVLRGSP
jgi:hypothetical protein